MQLCGGGSNSLAATANRCCKASFATPGGAASSPITVREESQEGCRPERVAIFSASPSGLSASGLSASRISPPSVAEHRTLMIARDHKPTTLLRGSFVALPPPDTPGPSPGRTFLMYTPGGRSCLYIRNSLPRRRSWSIGVRLCAIHPSTWLRNSRKFGVAPPRCGRILM